MAAAANPSQLAEYFAYLEARYGKSFSLDVLTDEELSHIAGLGAQALAAQPEDQKVLAPLGPLMGLIRGKMQYRAQHRLITSRLSS